MVAVLTRRHTKKGVAMQSTMPSLAVALPPIPFLFSPLSLYARLLTLTDQRDPRGVRYPLAVLLTIATLAKLAEHLPRGRPLRVPSLTGHSCAPPSSPTSSGWIVRRCRMPRPGTASLARQ